ncbi:hypothetical protein [Clostridium paraputrificum]|uniref:hypothetical protein n=1 Tax=Clostridium paraputrificum TaxID=29363 RepID=UPI00189FA331|nr:hypothetical protein [Clostridium paraputrificum]
MAVESKGLMEKFIEYTTSNYLFKNIATGVETFIDSAESDKLSKTVDTEDIKGGVYNQTFTTINKNEKIALEVVDVLSREELNLARWGAVMQKGSDIVATAQPKMYDAISDSSTVKIILDEEPIDTEDVAIYDNKDRHMLTLTTDYTINGKDVEIKLAGAKATDKFFVGSYKYMAPADTEYYNITGETQPTIYEVTRFKPIYNLDDEIVYWRETHMPRVQLDKAIEETGNTEKTKQTSTYTCNVLRDPNMPYTMQTIHRKVKK